MIMHSYKVEIKSLKIYENQYIKRTYSLIFIYENLSVWGFGFLCDEKHKRKFYLFSEHLFQFLLHTRHCSGYWVYREEQGRQAPFNLDCVYFIFV